MISKIFGGSSLFVLFIFVKNYWLLLCSQVDTARRLIPKNIGTFPSSIHEYFDIEVTKKYTQKMADSRHKFVMFLEIFRVQIKPKSDLKYHINVTACDFRLAR